MKPDEAIERLQRIRQFYLDTIKDDTAVEAVDMAIKVVEKQEVGKCCETCKYEHLDLDEYPCCDCIRAKDHYIPYTEEES